MSLLDLLQMGEPGRLDALWREHEKLKAMVGALAELLVAKSIVTRRDIDELRAKVAADHEAATP